MGILDLKKFISVYWTFCTPQNKCYWQCRIPACVQTNTL